MSNRDRTQKKKTGNDGKGGDKLREVELRYHAIFEHAPCGILLIDTDGAIIEFNEAAHRQLGYSREEFARLRISDIDPFESLEEIEKSIRKVLEEGEAEFEVRHVTKSGEIRNVHVITKAMDFSGRVVFQTIWNDITEKKRAEEALTKYGEHLEALMEERTIELKRVNKQLQKDIAERKLAEQEREELVLNLQEALDNVKTLRGLLPICAWCKKIHDDKGYWKKVETYIEEHSDALFTHSICPECLEKNDPELYEKLSKNQDGFREFLKDSEKG